MDRGLSVADANSPDIHRVPGVFAARIAALTGSGNGDSRPPQRR
jgi:hypothetical protein